MFKEVLKEVVDGADGSVAALLMGFDGLPVEQYVREHAGEKGADIEMVGIEFGVLLTTINETVNNLEFGAAKEVAVRTAQMTTLARKINAEYFVAVTLLPTANAGKARFLLRTRAEKLAAELA